jgi:phosphoribosylaminoimidazole-succinocarboxamide synthase
LYHAGMPQASGHAVALPTSGANTGATFATDLNLPGRRQGKVRDIYDLPADATHPARVLMVATDRISAFDVVMPTPIPGKGRLLTAISAWWFGFIHRKGLAATHLLSTDPEQVPAFAFSGKTTRPDLAGRIMIARRCRVVPIECVVRGYLEGSGWKEYKETGAVCGVKLPKGLKQCDRLPEPIFTPATKAPQGQHDENISFERACDEVGGPLMTTLRDRSLAIYKAAAEHALSRGIIIADTKFEWGTPEGSEGGYQSAPKKAAPSADPQKPADPILIDEALTPDSSRFWPADTYRPGGAQKSFDKQFLREYLQTLVDAGQWNKQAPGPDLPRDVVEGTLAKYREAMERLCV